MQLALVICVSGRSEGPYALNSGVAYQPNVYVSSNDCLPSRRQAIIALEGLRALPCV